MRWRWRWAWLTRSSSSRPTVGSPCWNPLQAYLKKNFQYMASHNVKLNEICCCCCCTWPDCAQEGCWGPRQSPWWGRGLAPWPPSCYTRGSHSLPGSPQGMAASARWTGARNRPCWSLSLHWASDVRVFAIWLGGSWTKPERTDLKSCKIILQFVMRMEMDLSM